MCEVLFLFGSGTAFFTHFACILYCHIYRLGWTVSDVRTFIHSDKNVLKLKFMRFDTLSIKRLLLHCYIFEKPDRVSKCSVLIASLFIPLLHFSSVCWHVSSRQLVYVVILNGILCWKSNCKAWNMFIMYCVLICNLIEDHHTITAKLNVLCYYVHIIHSCVFHLLWTVLRET